MIDLRHSIARHPIAQTPILRQWDCAMKDSFLEEVIDCIDRKSVMMQMGIDTMSPLEKFGILVMMSHYEMMCGKITKETLLDKD